jgi:hypothetical protein
VWPGSLGSRVENRALAGSSLAEDNRDLTECLTTEDVRQPLSPFDARFPVITVGRGIHGDLPSRFRQRRPASGRTAGVPPTLGAPLRPERAPLQVEGDDGPDGGTALLDSASGRLGARPLASQPPRRRTGTIEQPRAA